MFNDVETVSDFVAVVVGAINSVVVFLITLGILFFLFTGLRLVMSAASGKVKAERKQALLWSVIALFVLVSIWGITRVLMNTFLGGSGYHESWTDGPNAEFPDQYPVPLN